MGILLVGGGGGGEDTIIGGDDAMSMGKVPMCAVGVAIGVGGASEEMELRVILLTGVEEGEYTKS